MMTELHIVIYQDMSGAGVSVSVETSARDKSLLEEFEHLDVEGLCYVLFWPCLIGFCSK